MSGGASARPSFFLLSAPLRPARLRVIPFLLFRAFRCLLCQRSPQIATRCPQFLFRLLRLHSKLQHHQRDSQIVSRRPQSVFRRRHTLPARLRQYPQCPVRKLFICQLGINHQLFIDMSPPHHHCRTQHVQHHLLRRPRLQPRRPCQHFRPHLQRDHDLRQPRRRHVSVRCNYHRRRPALARILQRSQHVRRRPARRDPHHNVVARQFLFAQIALRVSNGILRPFHRPGNRSPSTRNQRLHLFLRNPKRRRTFRRIQHRHSPARSRPHINQPPPVLHPPHNDIHCSRNRRNLPPHRHRNLAVLSIHQPHDLQRRHAVKILGRRIPLFCEAMLSQEMIRESALRAPAFLRLGSHPRIIQASENVPFHSHSWLCASDKCNGLRTCTMNDHASRSLRRIATHRQPN